ncbi:MAG: beta-galactosidase [Acidobacteriota bacterium]
MTHSNELRGGVLHRDGRPRLFLAGDYPYYRDTPALWAPKLARLCEVGVEVVTLYVPWRHHLVADSADDSTDDRAAEAPDPAAPPGGRFVFDTQDLASHGDDNRDLVGFLRLVAEAGLLALVKPGPFVHGEIQLGGLPDSVSPSHDPRFAASIGAAGAAETEQGLEMPSPLSDAFRAASKAWLEAVRREVIEPFRQPHGPIVAVQLGNEGIYSNSSKPITAYDYSEPALRSFRGAMARKYRVVDLLNRAHDTEHQSFGEVEPVRAWPGADALVPALDRGAWAGEYLNEVYATWASWLGDLSKTANLLPPARAEWLAEHDRRARLDAWLARVRPEGLPEGVAYAFTSWVGAALEDDEGLAHYAIAALRAPSLNVEENWSLRWNDARCSHAAVPVYQSLFALGLGSPGFNVYPAVATADWGPQISMDREFLAATIDDPSVHDPPYARVAPIGVDAEPADKFEVLRLLFDALGARSESLASCRPRADVAWGFVARQAQVAAWNPPADERWKGLRLPQPAGESLVPFLHACHARDVGFEIVDLESTTLDELKRRPRLVVTGSYFLDESTQELLADYVEGGGRLVVAWESPLFDDQLRHCEIVQDRLLGHGFTDLEQAVEIPGLGSVASRPLRLPSGAEPLLPSAVGAHGYRRRVGDGEVIYLDVALDAATAPRSLDWLELTAPARGGDVDRPPLCLELENPSGDTAALVVLARHTTGSRITRRWRGRMLTLDLPRGGSALVEVAGAGSDARLVAGFVKAVVEIYDLAVAPTLRWGDEGFVAAAACDLGAWREPGEDTHDRWTVRTVSPQRAVDAVGVERLGAAPAPLVVGEA